MYAFSFQKKPWGRDHAFQSPAHCRKVRGGSSLPNGFQRTPLGPGACGTVSPLWEVSGTVELMG